VDYKFVCGEDFDKLSGTKKRAALGSFARDAAAALEASGFGEGSVERAARDANAYTRLDVAYESAFSKPEALRTKLLIELNHTPLHLAPTLLPLGPHSSTWIVLSPSTWRCGGGAASAGRAAAGNQLEKPLPCGYGTVQNPAVPRLASRRRRALRQAASAVTCS